VHIILAGAASSLGVWSLTVTFDAMLETTFSIRSA